MEYLLYFIQEITLLYLRILQLSLIVRIVLSSFPPKNGEALGRLSYALTEMYLFPLRNVSARINKMFFYTIYTSNCLFGLILSVTVFLIDFLR